MIVLYTVPLGNYNKIFYVDMLVLSYFFSATYLLILIVLFTSNNITEEIVLSSIYSFMVVFTAYMYFAKRYNIQYNIPNIVTTARLIINIFILICVINIKEYTDILIFSLILISLALDGIDGYLSRYLKQMTSFGELFDQEVDNFLILVLTFSLIQNFDYSIFIICIPLYRYIFLMLMGQGVISNENLPESYLRKAICIGTILILSLCNFYNTVESIRSLIYIITMLITYSFIRDTVYLYRRRNV